MRHTNHYVYHYVIVSTTLYIVHVYDHRCITSRVFCCARVSCVIYTGKGLPRGNENTSRMEIHLPDVYRFL